MYSVGCDLDKPWSIFSERDEEFVDAKYLPEANVLLAKKTFGVQQPDRVFALPKNSKLKLMGDVIMLTDAAKWSTVQAFVDENTNFVYGVGKAF